MDSVFNDIEFLMGNIKQEAPSSNERAAPIASEGVQNNDTDQLAMSTYMTDFILDYINRSLKVKQRQQSSTSCTCGKFIAQKNFLQNVRMVYMSKIISERGRRN